MRSSLVACYEHPLPVLGVVLYDAYIVSRLFIRRPYTTRTLFPPFPPCAACGSRLSSSTVFLPPSVPPLFLPLLLACINSFPTTQRYYYHHHHHRRLRPSAGLLFFSPLRTLSFSRPLSLDSFLSSLLRLSPLRRGTSASFSFSYAAPPPCLFLRPLTTSANTSGVESTRSFSLSLSLPPSRSTSRTLTYTRNAPPGILPHNGFIVLVRAARARTIVARARAARCERARERTDGRTHRRASERASKRVSERPDGSKEGTYARGT